MSSALLTLVSILSFAFSAAADNKTITMTDSCQSKDGSIKVTIETNSAPSQFRWLSYSHKSTLEINDQEIPRVTEECFETPGVRKVVRCPHRIEMGVHAEVYPRFKKDNYGELDKVVIIQTGSPKIELKNCGSND